MSRTVKGAKRPGYEYWSRRACNGYSPSSENKRMTNRIERRARQVERQISGYSKSLGSDKP